jgi:dienelactone hydrolase
MKRYPQMSGLRCVFAVLFTSLLIGGCDVPGDNVQLIPRSVLCRLPSKFSPVLSRFGDKIAYISRRNEGDKDVDLCIEDVNGNIIKKFCVKMPSGLLWAFTNEHILIMQDCDGDENDHVTCLDIRDGTLRDLTPFKGAKSMVGGLSKKYPNEILVLSNKRDLKWFDVYRINVVTGESRLVLNGTGYVGNIFDENFELRILVQMMPDCSCNIYSLEKGKRKLFKKIKHEDVKGTGPSHFGSDCKTLYCFESVGRDKSALVAYDVAKGSSRVLAENELADISEICCDPNTFAPQYACIDYLEPEIHVMDSAIKNDIAYLKKKLGRSNVNVKSRSQMDDVWLIRSSSSDSATKYYIYKRDPRKRMPISLRLLFNSRPDLDGYCLQKKEPMIVKSRDGLDLVCYLTKSANFQRTAIKKLVIYVHGGPHARDNDSFESFVQLLANRGYSVLQVNYRGSTGFGKRFTNAADGNLDSVRNDITDCVNWAINNGVADKEYVAIMGWSFGGYSTLAGLAFTPDVFRCGIDGVGMSNLHTLLSTIPEYWRPLIEEMYKLYGNPRIKNEYEKMMRNSPLFYADKIRRPLLVLHGKNDPRVKKEESDRIVSAVKKNGSQVAYVIYPDEGHGFDKEPNRRSSIVFIENFLAKTMGGLLEPIGQNDLKGSSHQVLEGADILTGTCR